MTHVLPPLRASATRPRSRSGGRARAAATGIPRTMLTSSLSNFPPRPPLTTPCGVARGRGTRGHASFCPSSSTSSLRPRMRPGRGLALPGAPPGGSPQSLHPRIAPPWPHPRRQQLHVRAPPSPSPRRLISSAKRIEVQTPFLLTHPRDRIPHRQASPQEHETSRKQSQYDVHVFS